MPASGWTVENTLKVKHSQVVQEQNLTAAHNIASVAEAVSKLSCSAFDWPHDTAYVFSRRIGAWFQLFSQSSSLCNKSELQNTFQLLHLTPSLPPKRQHKPPTDVFISHSWGVDELGRETHSRVMHINTLLLLHGMSTWLDSQDLVASPLDIDTTIADGIDKATVVLVFLTRSYIDKCKMDYNNNCKAEFTYATNRNKYIVPIVFEPSLLSVSQWTGPVGLRLGSALFIDMSSDSGMQTALTQLVARVKAVVKTTSNVLC
eukprot:c7082_g1_i2.p1 GENE.c7082_g1_i2~~c7082_g1_i2.p1  ORF type:complete len:260 (-),score=61.94 c7082_g1_i2:235-1014(-)